jgi:hypothetical protein
MDRIYWLDRQRQALGMAHASSNPEGWIAHIELARRFGIEAGAGRRIRSEPKVPAPPEAGTSLAPKGKG